MGAWDKLLQIARNSPTNVRFRDLCCLAELAGFERKRSRGSHVWFYNPSIPHQEDAGISLQRGESGKAKPYQVRQLLNRIEQYDLGPKQK